MEGREISRRNFLGLAGLVAGAALIPGCRSVPLSGNTNSSLSNEVFNVSRVSQRDNTYKASLVGIGDKGYFVTETPYGVALFDYDKAIRVALPSVRDSKSYSERIVSGECFDSKRGVYELKPAKNTNNNEKSLVKIANIKTDIQKFEGLRKSNELLSSRRVTEKTGKYNLPTIELPKIGRCYVVETTENLQTSLKDYKEGKFYKFYVIPVHNSQINLESNGKISIINKDNILIPTFVSYEELKKQEERAQTQEAEAREATMRNKNRRELPQGSSSQ